jgi:hypothetical protein
MKALSSKTLCHPERSKPVSKANRTAQSKDLYPLHRLRKQAAQGTASLASSDLALSFPRKSNADTE